MSAAAPLLAMERVARSFVTPGGNVAVLHDIALELRPGDYAALTGPSGSGKSTLLHLAALLDRPDAGSVWWSGRDVGRLPERERSRLRAACFGMIFQRFHLLPHRSVLDNVLLRFRYTRTGRAEALRRSSEAIERLGLGPRAGHPARLLSGGEMQRVAIARAVALPPPVLLADEPAGSLDAAATAGVMDALDHLNRAGIAILLATHNAALLPRCSRRFALDGGRLTEAP